MELTYDIAISDATETTNALDVYVVTRPDGQVFRYDISKPFLVQVRADVETTEEAKQIAAMFPKSVGVKGGPIFHLSDGVTRGYIHMDVRLSADGVNQGTNETGIKRILSLVRHCAKNGITLTHTARWGNSSPRTISEYWNGKVAA